MIVVAKIRVRLVPLIKYTTFSQTVSPLISLSAPPTPSAPAALGRTIEAAVI